MGYLGKRSRLSVIVSRSAGSSGRGILRAVHYESLLRHWRAPEAAVVTPVLLAACDRHTHESRANTDKATFDLSLMDAWQVPFEILSVLRLRETLGLALPLLEHPLVATPLGRLPAIEAPYTDDVLKAVLPRMAAHIPHFQIA